MKKFIKEFKEFALKGNVMDMAVGVIIGAAFGNIVTALTTDFINPLINSIGGASFGGKIHLFWTGTGDNAQYLLWGDFLTQVVNFIIMALCIFIMVKAVNKLVSLGKKEEVVEPKEKECPYCMSKISIKATRCPHCTSQLK